MPESTIEASAPAKKEVGDVVLEVKNLKKYFPIEQGFFRTVTGHVKAVDGVSFTIPRRRNLWLSRGIWQRENNAWALHRARDFAK